MDQSSRQSRRQSDGSSLINLQGTALGLSNLKTH